MKMEMEWKMECRENGIIFRKWKNFEKKLPL